MLISKMTDAMIAVLIDLGYTFCVVYTSLLDQKDYVQYFTSATEANTFCQIQRFGNNRASVHWYEDGRGWFEDFTA